MPKTRDGDDCCLAASSLYEVMRIRGPPIGGLRFLVTAAVGWLWACSVGVAPALMQRSVQRVGGGVGVAGAEHMSDDWRGSFPGKSGGGVVAPVSA